ncbi:PAS domain-containing protein [Ideonella sp. 4Y16]|uniref:hybrid sensor histidine kinase/response regulator n=1 Tax=Ideonella alba TaxID=2824118 RepID=UPI001B37BA5E|nr:PAS domain-containing hybrid sensor histidine kinase/response regulator [Ideonella alba]MBQ0943969.1 PAS domain-containing protein [Ideonella alba]
MSAPAAPAAAGDDPLALWWFEVPMPSWRLAADGWQGNRAAQDWLSEQQPPPEAWSQVLARLAEAPTDRPCLLTLAPPGIALQFTPQALGAAQGWWLQRFELGSSGLVSVTELLELLRGHGPVGSLVRDLDTGIGQWDGDVFEMLGVPPAQGTPDFEQALAMVHEADRAAFLERHQVLSAEPGRYSLRFRVRRPDGQTRHLLSLTEVLAARGGHGRRLVSLLFDETDSVVRHQAEREASDDLSSVLAMAGVSVWRVDVATQTVQFNEAGYRMIGLPAREAPMPLAEVRALIHPDDLARVVNAAAEASHSQSVVDVMARYRDGDSGWRRLLTRRVARRDADGVVRTLLGVSLDLSELSQERDRALALMDRMRLVTDAIGVGFWWRDLDGGLLEWDQQMYRLHHRDPSEGTPSLDEFLERHVHALDRPMLIDRQRRHISEWPATSEITFRILTPEGQTRWIQSWTQRHWREGHRLSFGMHVDVTAQREAQWQAERERERDRFAIEAAGIGVWEVPLDGRQARWSPSMYALFGRPPTESVSPLRVMAEALDRGALADTREALRRCRLHGRDFRVEHAVKWPDGSQRWLLSFGRLQCDSAGQPMAVTGVAIDITGRRRSEELARERDRAEQASLAKSALMARVSHELRTPMNAVLGFAELMALDALSATQQERLRCIRAAGGHLMELIDDLLSLSRADAAGTHLTTQPVPVSEVLAEVCQWVDALAQAHGVQIEARQAMNTAAWVQADRRRLGQVLTNLLTNAIKYNRAGGQVWIELSGADLDGTPAWSMAVRDNGRGLSPEQQVHLFEPFNRLGAEREGIPGNGIGLSIVRQLITDMGGRLAVSSQIGQGSVFRVDLAAVVPPEQSTVPASRQGTARSPVPPSAPTQGPIEVLYVEDNAVNELLVSQALSLRPRFHLRTAGDGAEGLALAARHAPRIVLLDMQLPDCHGLELLQRMRQLPALAGSRFMALSANAMPDDMQAALAAGFHDYWTKPLDVQRFLDDMDAQAAQLGR